MNDTSNYKAADLTPVSEIMSRGVVQVKPELGLDALEELMLSHAISGAPVVDDHGRPIGIVSKTDLLHGNGSSSGPRATVRDVMMRTAYCLAENEPITRAAGLMAYEGVHRVPIVDHGGAVVGVVSPLDIMRWLARQYGYPIGNRP